MLSAKLSANEPIDPGVMPDAYIATANRQAQRLCDLRNEYNVGVYEREMNGRIISFLNGRGSTLPPPPEVPKKFVVTAPDPITGIQDWVESDQPACDVISDPADMVTPAKKPNTIHIGKRNFGNWFSVGPEDSIQSGETVPGTSEDGVNGMFMKYGAPVGPGWYLLQA